MLLAYAKAQTDSAAKPTTTSITNLHLALSGTFSAQHNWYDNEHNFKSIALLFNGDASHRITTPKLKHTYSLRTNLGYLKILDSIWIKNNDYWRISGTIIENQNKWLAHTYSFTARSQFLNTWRFVYDSNSDQYVKTKTATFFNPAVITLAYGMSYSFWDDNLITFNFAAVNFNTKPRFGNYKKSNDLELAKTNTMYLYADYGLNVNDLQQAYDSLLLAR